MNEEHKNRVHEKYKLALQKGERFWPDSIYKDLIVSLGIFIVLILLATFVGVPGEPKADPSDSAYIPRPEWYFLFLFKFLALWGKIPLLGKIEWFAAVVVPACALLILVLLPFIDRNPYRHYSRRVLAITIMGLFIVGVVVLTMIANIPTTSGTGGLSLLTLLQILAGMILPLVAYVLLIVLSALGKQIGQKTGTIQAWVAGAAAVSMLALGVWVVAIAPPAAAGPEVQVANTIAEKITLGQDLYSINCAECHGEDGTVTVIQGVQGLDGKQVVPIHSHDVMYTLNDQALADIISYGRPDSGMTPFGRAYDGPLGPSEIDTLVTFMRYTWDDRATLPAGQVIASSIPDLKPGEVPTFETNIQPLVKRYCLSCHRAGKTNNNYLVTSYDEMLNTGDNAPVMTAGDGNSLLLQLINGHPFTDAAGNTIRQMPPTKLLDQKFIDMLTQWVMNGMPK